MLITFRTISGEAFKLEFEESNTVGEMKDKVASTKGETYAKELQKLIYNGKILEDGQKVSEINIDDKKFVVVMVSRPKKAEPASTSAASSEKSSAVPSSNTTGAKTSTEKKAEPASQGGAAQPTASTPRASSTEVPPEYSQTEENIQAMGYPKEEVVRALKAAFFNADRAVEYLCTGIPEALNINEEGAAGAAGAEEAGQESGGEEEEGIHDLEFLANSPQFQHLRDLVRTDPSILPTVVGQIAEQNPELMDIIRNNQDAFVQLLNAPPAAGAGAEAAGAGGPLPGEGNIAQQAASGVMTISITPQDREAINRLMGLGFPESLAVEAYLACDKNEELAANYILARMEEFNQEAGQGGGNP